jgi:two-component system, NtrC family, nitrogen regulation sensor histidine kinase NtrY
MTFRTRLLLLFAVAVLASVGGVEWVVSRNTRQAFERLDAQRRDALLAQFRREFARRGQEIVRGVKGIAASESALTIAIALNQPSPDLSPWVNEASVQAAAHGLDLLELVADDGAIVSSAQAQARFGYKQPWIAERSDWGTRGAFLHREELPDGAVLALVAVGVAAAGDRKLYVAGGQKLDSEFLASLVLPAGMRVLLDTQQSLIGASGPIMRARELAALAERVRKQGREQDEVVEWGSDAATAEAFRAIPLRGTADELLGVLLIGSARRELVELERFLRRTGAMVAGAGVLLALLLAWWATARVTRPVHELVVRASDVAAGNWNATVAVQSADEIGQLALAFNRMTRQLVEQRERLVQAERVAAWRELARRLAHELKNPLFPLQITVENMQRARDSHPEQFDEVFREGSATLLAELANLKQIVARFSEFARMPPPQLETVNLNELAAVAMKLFEPQLERAHVAGKLDLDAGAPEVQADPEQLSGVLRNLMLNAVDAMPHGGTLTLRTRRLDSGARIEVSDTGEGLTPEECSRLFTPYYTTKTHGTGLGLAIVQSVVSDHKGRITVESEPGKGSTFRIDLG